MHQMLQNENSFTICPLPLWAVTIYFKRPGKKIVKNILKIVKKRNIREYEQKLFFSDTLEENERAHIQRVAKL